VKKHKTPTFLLELPLGVDAQQARHLRAHFEAARCLYNALLGEAMKRLRLMRADPRWQQARRLPKTCKQERHRLFSELRQEYGFSEYALHASATSARTTWIADHLDSNTAQKLATRAYQAANRVCLGQAKSVRFKSKGRGLDSVEGKNNKQGLRFVLQAPEEGSAGYLLWQQDRLPALIDWYDPVVKHGLGSRIKYVRLIRRQASGPQSQGTDCAGYRYYAQLALEGVAYQKPKHQAAAATVGLDLGPSTIAIVPQEGEARLLSFCSELKTDKQKKRRLQRKSLHGRLVHEVVACGNRVITEKLSYKAWQKQYGKSVGAHAPGMFMEHLKRTVARTGGILHEVPTGTTKLSQYCHGCGIYVKKALSQRWHQCSCGIGPVQRDLYSAFLSCHLDLRTLVPSIAHQEWESAETRLRAAIEDADQRATAGQVLPQSMGIPRAGARLPRSLPSDHQELLCRVGRGALDGRSARTPALLRRGVSGRRS
jgi:transposase